MRIMGIDYGDARTGLAVSDAMNILVGEAWTVNQWDANTLADEIIRQAVARGDERRSSIEAHAILHANGKKEKKHRKTVDAVAASLILEGYLGTL